MSASSPTISARADAVCASMEAICAVCTSTCVRALSSVTREPLPLRNSSCCRSRVRRFSASVASARSRCAAKSFRFASARARVALARSSCARLTATSARPPSTSACAASRRALICSENSRATTCFAFTGELKSTRISTICPESCEPTSTVETGVSVPVARTLAVIGPRSTAASR